MEIKTLIDGIRQDAINQFRNPYQLLFREKVEHENDLREQYKSREIFELLQNIDDAFDPDCRHECEAVFKLSGDWLEVSNFGKPFTADTLSRLCQGSVSSKLNRFIGCKGIGFRSVLNWADIVEIYSGSGDEYISVRFSEEFANKQFLQIKDETPIAKQVKELEDRGIEPQYPILKAPEYIQPIAKEFDTVIRIHIKNEDARERITRDLESFDSYVILFLPNIQLIRFINADGNQKEIRKIEHDGIVEISETGKPTSKYFFREKNGTLKIGYKGAKTMKLAVALPLNDSAESYPLYSFFPINDQNSPFKALLHATFCLTDNRNELDIRTEGATEVNRQIFSELLNLYVSTVCEYDCEQRRIEILKPLKFTGPNFQFNGNLAKLDCEETFKNYCANYPVFYSVNGQYIQNIDEPIFFTDVPDHFRTWHFGRIVKLSSDLLPFAEWIAGKANQSEQYLLEAINSESAAWSAKMRIETFKWWYATTERNRLPRLLKNISGDFLESQTEACFLSGGIQSVPEWAKLTILNAEDEKELLNAYKADIEEQYRNERNEKEDKDSGSSQKRILSRLIRKGPLNLQEQSSHRALISHVNSSINNSYEKAVDFVKWLLEIRKNKEFEESTINEIKFNMPTALGAVAPAKLTYLNVDYNNPLGDEIFGQMHDYYPIASPQQLGLEGFRPELTEMFLRIGVSATPRIETITYESDSKTHNDYIESLRIPESNIRSYRYSLESVRNLPAILSHLSTSTILKWLDRDSRAIEHRYEPETSYIDYLPHKQGQRYYYRFMPENHLPSFIRFEISTTKWIDISGKKYRPDEIILSNDEFLSSIGYPTLPDSEISKLASAASCSVPRVKQLLIAAGANETVLTLSSTNFYDILLKISELDDWQQIEQSKKFSQKLYRDIIRNGRSDEKLTLFFAPSPNKTRFFEQGKVLATQNRKESRYLPVRSVFFANSAVSNISNQYFIDIPPRSGQKSDFKEILNIDPYSQQFSVTGWTTANGDPEFQRNLREFLPYLMAYRLNAIQEVNNLKITLVSAVSITGNDNTTYQFEPYSVFEKSRSQWLILIDENTGFQLNKLKIAENLIEIFNVFFNFPSREFLSKINQYFLADKNSRDYFIQSDLGSTDELDEARKGLNINSEICRKVADGIAQLRPDVDIRQLINNTNWIDCSTVETQQNIAGILLQSGVTLDELSNLADVTLSLRELNQHKISESYNRCAQIFNLSVYNDLTSRPDLHNQFINRCAKFQQPKLPQNETRNPQFNAWALVHSEMVKTLKEFGITYSDASVSANDFDAIFESNLSQLQKENKRLYINEFLNNREYLSLMYFPDYSVIKKHYNQFISEQYKQEQQETEPTDNDLSELIDKANINPRTPKGKIPSFHKESGHTTTVDTTSKQHLDKSKQKQGDIAEYIVIAKLIRKEIPEVINFLGPEYNIYWKSGAARRVPVSSEFVNKFTREGGIGDGIGYDIAVISKNGDKRLFLEVKSSTSGGCSFILSHNEYQTATKSYTQNERYRIVFVGNLNIADSSSVPTVHFIDHDLDSACFQIQAKDLYVAYTAAD